MLHEGPRVTDEERQALLDQLIQDPASASVDGRSATAHKPKDIIEAMEYQAEKANPTRSAWGRVRMARGITGGCSPQ